MKHLKMLSPLAIAAAVTMAFTSSAFATVLTDFDGNKHFATTQIWARSEGIVTLHPPIGAIECKESNIEGFISNAGGAEETVRITLEALTFAACNASVTVIAKGSLEIHTKETAANGDGTLTSTGAEVTVEFVGVHCIFRTNGTDIGTFTGSQNFVKGIDHLGGIEIATLEHGATVDLEATIPRTGGRSGAFCGSTAKWTGSYELLSPAYVDVD